MKNAWLCMTDQNNSHRAMRFLIIAASFVIIIWGINQAQSVVALFLVSVFLALIGTPAVLWMERKHIPSFAAVMIVMACMIVLLLMIGGIVGVSLNSLSNSLPYYQTRIQEQVLAIKPLLASKHIVITDKVLLEYFNPGADVGTCSRLARGNGFSGFHHRSDPAHGNIHIA